MGVLVGGAGVDVGILVGPCVDCGLLVGFGVFVGPNAGTSKVPVNTNSPSPPPSNSNTSIEAWVVTGKRLPRQNK